MQDPTATIIPYVFAAWMNGVESRPGSKMHALKYLLWKILNIHESRISIMIPYVPITQIQ